MHYQISSYNYNRDSGSVVYGFEVLIMFAWLYLFLNNSWKLIIKTWYYLRKSLINYIGEIAIYFQIYIYIYIEWGCWGLRLLMPHQCWI
jgi:hypothetical protein